MLTLKVPNAVAELRESDPFKNADDRVADFFHDAADAADPLIRAGAAFVELFAHTTYRSKRPIDQPNDYGQSNLVRRKAKTVSTGNTTAAFEDSGGAQIIQDLLEETFGDILLIGSPQGLLPQNVREMDGASEDLSSA